MADKVCSSGWILTHDPVHGNYVPFFVKVRDKDIVWDPDNMPKDLSRLTAAAESNITYNYPAFEWIYKKSGWRINLRSDYTYEATKDIPIKGNSTLVNVNELKVKIDLPIKTKNTDTLFVDVMKKCTNRVIIGATTNLIVGTTDVLTEVHISLNSTGGFSSNFATSPDYDNQFLQVKVRGDIKI